MSGSVNPAMIAALLNGNVPGGAQQQRQPLPNGIPMAGMANMMAGFPPVAAPSSGVQGPPMAMPSSGIQGPMPPQGVQGPPGTIPPWMQRP